LLYQATIFLSKILLPFSREEFLLLENTIGVPGSRRQSSSLYVLFESGVKYLRTLLFSSFILHVPISSILSKEDTTRRKSERKQSSGFDVIHRDILNMTQRKMFDNFLIAKRDIYALHYLHLTIILILIKFCLVFLCIILEYIRIYKSLMIILYLCMTEVIKYRIRCKLSTCDS